MIQETIQTDRKTFNEVIESIPLIDTDIKNYFELYEIYEKGETYKSKCWNWFNQNLIKELKEIIFKKEYWDCFYNDNKAIFILKELGIKEPYKINGCERTPFNKHIGEFVYIWNSFKRDFEEKEQEENLKNDLLNRGFKEQKIIEKISDTEIKDYTEDLKKLNGLKVICVFDRDKIGIMGSFTKKEEHEGKLIYNERGLFFLPKRHTKTGQLLINKFYYKEIEK